MIKLSDVQQVVDHSIFHRIRKVLVELGYLPDVLDRTTYPETKEGQVAWNNALTLIKEQKGFVIEIFGTSSNQSRYAKKVPRIVINSDRYIPGNVGNSPTSWYERNAEGVLESFTLPPSTSDYRFEVGIVANTSKQERILNSIISAILPNRNYIPFWKEDTEGWDAELVFLVLRRNQRHFNNTNEGIMEKYFLYEAVDLLESVPTLLETNVPVLQEIVIESTVSPKDQVPTENGMWYYPEHQGLEDQPENEYGEGLVNEDENPLTLDE